MYLISRSYFACAFKSYHCFGDMYTHYITLLNFHKKSNCQTFIHVIQITIPIKSRVYINRRAKIKLASFSFQ